MTNRVESVRSTLVAEFAHGHGRAVSSTRVGPSSKSMSSSRRKRSNAFVLGPQELNVPVSSPLDSRSHERPHLGLKRARVEGATHHAGNAQLPRKLSRLAVPLTNSGDPPPLLQTPRTPRQPLADLLLPPGSNTRGYMRPLETLQVTGGPSTIPMPRSWPPLQPLDHARQDLQSPTITRRRSAALGDIPLAIGKSATGLPTAAGSSDQDALSKAIKIEEILEPKLTGIFSIQSSPLSSPPSSAPLVTRPDPNETSMNMAPPYTQQHLRLRDDMPDAPQVELVPVPPPSSDPFSSNPDASPPKSMSLRDRRAQMSRVSRMRVQSSSCRIRTMRPVIFSLGVPKLDASFRWWCPGRMRKSK